MGRFLDIPFLPEGRVALAVSGFAAEGVKAIRPPRLSALPEALRRHADLGLCPIGGNTIVCPPDSYEYYVRALSPYGFSVICGGQPLGRSYPEDTAYNVVVAGKYALLNPKLCDKILLRLIEARFEILPVKQGYAKCSVCPVSANALITADPGIARRCEAKELNVLLISNSGVELPPYSSGFFGGATGLVAKDALAVNGSLGHMKSGGKILDFLANYGIRPLEISAAPPFDTGSLIPLMLAADNNR